MKTFRQFIESESSAINPLPNPPEGVLVGALQLVEDALILEAYRLLPEEEQVFKIPRIRIRRGIPPAIKASLENITKDRDLLDKIIGNLGILAQYPGQLGLYVHNHDFGTNHNFIAIKGSEELIKHFEADLINYADSLGRRSAFFHLHNDPDLSRPMRLVVDKTLRVWWTSDYDLGFADVDPNEFHRVSLRRASRRRGPNIALEPAAQYLIDLYPLNINNILFHPEESSELKLKMQKYAVDQDPSIYGKIKRKHPAYKIRSGHP